MFKDYYKILEIHRLATDEEIKKSFRRLALLFHPDKNHSPQAHDLFVEINEAYNVLSDLEKKKKYDEIYDLRLQIVSQNPQPPPQKFHKVYRKKKREKAKLNVFYVEITRLLVMASFALSLLLLFDYILPAEKIQQTVISRFHTTTSYFSDIVKTQDKEFPIDMYIAAEYIRDGQKISIYLTPTFKIVKEIEVQTFYETKNFTPHYSIFSVFSFFIILQIFFSSSVIFFKSDEIATSQIGISCGLLMIFTIFVLLF